MTDLKKIAADVRSAARWIDDSCGGETEIGTELREHAAALDALASAEPVACKKCHGEGWYDEGDPDIGSAIFECDRCLGTKVEHTCGEQASCAPCEANDEREAQCDGGSCGTGGYCKACPEKRCQSGVVHCDGACHGLMPDGFAASMPPEREVAVAAAQRIGFWLSAALDDPKVRAELKADINAWFDAAMPFPQPAPPQPAGGQGEAVSSIDYWQKRGHHVCADCNGTKVRSYRQAEHLGGQYVDVPCHCATPAAPQRISVSREALVAAYAELFNNDDPSALRALGITITE